jgi:hypothetical protein
MGELGLETVGVKANAHGIPVDGHLRTAKRLWAVGTVTTRFSAPTSVSEVAKTATYSRAYSDSNGFLALLSDGERLTGAYALGREAGEWLQQATRAIRARIPLDVLRSDTIQPFSTFSEIYVAALKMQFWRVSGNAPNATVMSSFRQAPLSSSGSRVNFKNHLQLDWRTSGRLPTPKTRHEETVSRPNTLRSNSTVCTHARIK